MPRATTGKTRTMWDFGDLKHDFNTLMNITFFLTNKIKLLHKNIQTWAPDLDVGCDVLLLLWNQMLAAVLAPFRSAERSYLGKRN